MGCLPSVLTASQPLSRRFRLSLEVIMAVTALSRESTKLLLTGYKNDAIREARKILIPRLRGCPL